MIARVYLISKRFKLFSIRVESSDSAFIESSPTSVTIASGKKSVMYFILEQLIDKGYIISIKGQKISRDKAIEEIMSSAFGVETENVRQLLNKFKERHNLKDLVRDMINEPILKYGN